MENDTNPYNFKGQRNTEHHAQGKCPFPTHKIPESERRTEILFSSLQFQLCHIFAVLQSHNFCAIYLILLSCCNLQVLL